MHAASVNSELKRTKRVKWRFSLLAAAANVAYERRQQTENERAAQAAAAAAQARNACNRVRTNMLQTKERERKAAQSTNGAPLGLITRN